MKLTEAATVRTFPDLPYEDRLIYIAGPFFDDWAADVISDIEGLLDNRGEKYFSPREYGIIADHRANKQKIDRIFDMNVRMVQECNIMIAVTDDFDAGTMFEVGMFYGVKRWNTPAIITFSAKGFGANVMIANATFTHCKDLEELDLALNGHEIEPLEVVE